MTLFQHQQTNFIELFEVSSIHRAQYKVFQQSLIPTNKFCAISN